MADDAERRPLLPRRRPWRRRLAAGGALATVAALAALHRAPAGERPMVLASKSSLEALGDGFDDPVLRRLWTPAVVDKLSDSTRDADATFALSLRDTECSPDGYVRMCSDVQCLAATGDAAAVAECLAWNNETQAQGPTLRLKLGDVVDVKVHNHKSEAAASLHFHGVHMPGTPYNDGASMISQAPLAPGVAETVRFLAYPAGTYFYHGHQGVDYADGMRGIIVIEDDEEHYYDAFVDSCEELLFSEWVHMAAQEQYALHLAQAGAAAALTGSYILVPDRESVEDGMINTVWWTSGLVNGQGAYKPLDEQDVILAEEIEGQSSEPYVIDIPAGSTKKLRIVHGGWFYAYYLTLEAHDFVLVAGSGTDMAPVEAATLMMAPSERWDVLVTADQPCGNYTLLWETHVADAAGGGRSPEGGYLSSAKGNFSAVLRYTECEAGETAPARPAAQLLQAETTSPFRPLQAMAAGSYRTHGGASPKVPVGPADATIALNLTYNVPGASGINWNFNDNLYAAPSAPLYLTKGKYGLATAPHRETMVYEIERGAVVDLEIDFAYRDVHTIHLHGYKFWVVEAHALGVGGSKTKNATSEYAGQKAFEVPAGSNYVDPPYVDTIALTEYAWVKLRFVADNPGWWHFHCHFLFHMMQGLQMVFDVGEAEQPEPSAAWWDALTYGAMRQRDEEPPPPAVGPAAGR